MCRPIRGPVAVSPTGPMSPAARQPISGMWTRSGLGLFHVGGSHVSVCVCLSFVCLLCLFVLQMSVSHGCSAHGRLSHASLAAHFREKPMCNGASSQKTRVQVESTGVIFSQSNFETGVLSILGQSWVKLWSSLGQACTALTAADKEDGVVGSEALCRGVHMLTFETNRLKGMCFQGVETRRFQHAGSSRCVQHAPPPPHLCAKQLDTTSDMALSIGMRKRL